MTTLSNTSSAAGATPSAASGPAHRRRVVDAPTRMFHWLFALCFLGAYLTADGERLRLVHVTLGYTLAGLLGFRVLYGLLGPRPARLSVLWRKVTGFPAWMRSLRHWRVGQPIAWRQGQNLMMGAAVLALLAVVAPVTLTGYATYNEWGGNLGGELLEELHETLGEIFLWLVMGHVALIVALSVLRRKNQALPMLTGKVEGAGPDLVRHNHRWLAALLLAGVLGFWVWQWNQPVAPAGGAADLSVADVKESRAALSLLRLSDDD